MYENDSFGRTRDNILRQSAESRDVFQRRNYESQSYAGAIKSNCNSEYERKSRQHGSLSMSWIGSLEDCSWLTRSVVGQLREIANIDQVNRRLESRGFVFSSASMGGKGVVWTFETECEREGFINNDFIWKDCFLSMSYWNGEKSQPLSLKWKDIYDVPLNYWCKSFFKKLGGQIGELAWIDRDTEFRGRFDKCRILTLNSQINPIEIIVNVRVRNTVFPVRLVESSDPVLQNWVDEVLGLKPGIFQNQKTKGGKDGKGVRSQPTEDSWLEKEPKSAIRKSSSLNLNLNLRRVEKPSEGDSSSSDQNGLEVASSTDKEDHDPCHRQLPSFPRMFSSGVEQSKDIISEKGIEICVDLREQENISKTQSSSEEGQALEDVKGEKVAGGSSEATPPDQVVSNLGQSVSELAGGYIRGDQVRTQAKSRGRGRAAIIKTHPMTTQKFKGTSQSGNKDEGQPILKGVKTRVIWHLEDEIAKVIEKGDALGINMQAKQMGDNSEVWDLQVEVAKVLETGAALGFDFHGQEVEITEIVSAMEKGDEVRNKK
ncbi:hypothetical protein LWI28_026107 [Acer negundo]|uniref:DUF4283 domain-containing protein n=1 Tax=Acer negundo TaxID=4023 RepID=A0AAD5I843_ACENE|nr:hypothetical protein LWI28_026107 [Acer negundo]